MIKSPLRWPGAKTKLKEVILRNLPVRATLVEPFVGGGSIFLAFLTSFSERRAIINDADAGVCDLWRIVLEGTNKEFDKLLLGIEKAKPSVSKFNEMKELRTGLATLCVNRWAFSGNLTGGPIGGKSQVGQYSVGCRFNSITIIKELKSIRLFCKGRVSVHCGDFSDLNVPTNAVVYADPPYVNKGDLLYREKMSIKDHKRLHKWITKLPNKWWLSYDDNPLIRNLYNGYVIKDISILYTTKGKRTKNNKTTEILITNDRILYEPPTTSERGSSLFV